MTMPITDTNVIDGPNVQNNGEYRGRLQFIFDDGRTVERNVRAADGNAWANLIVDLPAEVEQWMRQQDAGAAAEGDTEIVDAEPGQATREEIAVAYLRKAYSLESPYEAFLKFDRFNNYRLQRGWNINQVVTGLASAGMTQEEWDVLQSSYQYLSNPARVTAMEAYQPIVANWEAREPL